MIHEQRFSAFFYGTLLHPKILKRVIDSDGSHLEICPAVLLVSGDDTPFLGVMMNETSSSSPILGLHQTSGQGKKMS